MDEILNLIRDRVSSRVLFDPERKISNDDLNRILEAARWSPTAHNMQNFEIIAVDDEKILKKISSINFPVSEIFVRENYKQLSFSVDELKKKKTGLLGTMFPPFMLNPDFKPGENKGENSNMMIGRLIQSSPVLLVALYNPAKRAPASDGDFLGIISLGCMMENMWLASSFLGIGFHVVSSISAAPVENEVRKILNIPENLNIAFSCRLGYPKEKQEDRLRVRREIEDFTHHNIF